METFCEDRSWDVFVKQLFGLLGLSCFLLAWVASTLPSRPPRYDQYEISRLTPNNPAPKDPKMNPKKIYSQKFLARSFTFEGNSIIF